MGAIKPGYIVRLSCGCMAVAVEECSSFYVHKDSVVYMDCVYHNNTLTRAMHNHNTGKTAGGIVGSRFMVPYSSTIYASEWQYGGNDDVEVMNFRLENIYTMVAQVFNKSQPVSLWANNPSWFTQKPNEGKRHAKRIIENVNPTLMYPVIKRPGLYPTACDAILEVNLSDEYIVVSTQGVVSTIKLEDIVYIYYLYIEAGGGMLKLPGAIPSWQAMRGFGMVDVYNSKMIPNPSVMF